MDFDILNRLANNQDYLLQTIPNVASKMFGEAPKYNLTGASQDSATSKEMSVQGGAIRINNLKGSKSGIKIALPFPATTVWYPVILSFRHGHASTFDAWVTGSSNKYFEITVTARNGTKTFDSVVVNWIAIVAHT